MRSLASVPAGATPEPRLSKTEQDCFRNLADIAYARAGLVLAEDKAPMVLARVGKRIRAIGASNIQEYCSFLASPNAEAECRELIFTLTTNVTSFMREEHHFRTIATEVLPNLAEGGKQGKQLRFWSAGCSSGQEPYSLAMTTHEHYVTSSKLDVKILATDIDANVLSEARAAVYSERQLSGLDSAHRSKFFSTIEQEPGAPSRLQVCDSIRELVTFKELNLLSDWPMRKKFQIIMCRNVVIYFDRETQRSLWRKFSEVLAPGGYLFLGHSERLDTAEFPQFHAAGTTTYRLAQ